MCGAVFLFFPGGFEERVNIAGSDFLILEVMAPGCFICFPFVGCCCWVSVAGGIYVYLGVYSLSCNLLAFCGYKLAGGHGLIFPFMRGLWVACANHPRPGPWDLGG